MKFHIKEQKPMFERFNAQWTPTQIVLDTDGVERHRIEGFLPAEDFIAQLDLGLGKLHFQHHEYAEAQDLFRGICDAHPETGASPEACYWAGVAAYKKSDDAKQLASAARTLSQRYPDSEWTRKASVWGR